jgi:hypothetical protein
MSADNCSEVTIMFEDWNNTESTQYTSTDASSKALFAESAQLSEPLPARGGMENARAPRGSDIVQQLDRTAFNRTDVENRAFELADRLLPLPGHNSRAFSQRELDALGRNVVRPGMQANPSEFVSYLQRSLRAAGYTNAQISTGTEVQQQRPSNPDSAYHPAPTRTPYIQIRDGATNIRIRY